MSPHHPLGSTPDITKALQELENGDALLIDKAGLQRRDIDADTKLPVPLSDGSLHITPERAGVNQDRVDDIMAELRGEFGGVWRELAK